MKAILPFVLIAVLGCLPKGGEPVSLMKASALLSGTIPPLDQAAPARTETATFALG